MELIKSRAKFGEIEIDAEYIKDGKINYSTFVKKWYEEEEPKWRYKNGKEADEEISKGLQEILKYVLTV